MGNQDQQKSGNPEHKPGSQQGGQDKAPGQQTQNPGQGGQQGSDNKTDKPAQQK